MRNLTIIGLAVLVLISSLAGLEAYAEEGEEKKLEEIVINLKELLKIPDAYDKFTSNLSSSGDRKIYYLSWQDSREELATINVVVDDLANISSYNIGLKNYKEAGERLARYSRQEAEEKARDFISKIDPSLYEEIKLLENKDQDNYLDDYYNFEFIRHINDLAYDQNRINISVNKYNLQVASYQASWEREGEFPKPEKVISLDEAKRIFKEKIGLVPIYKMRTKYRIFEEEDGAGYFLAYGLLEDNMGIDAFSGEKLAMGRNIFFGAKEMAMGEAQEDEADRGLTPEERQSLEKLKGILSVDKAEEKARQLMEIDSSYKLKDKYLNRDYKNRDHYIWNLYFAKEDPKDEDSYINLSLDGRKGDLLGFYKSFYQEPDAKGKISRDEALEIARDFIRKQEPDKFKQVELIDNEDIKENDKKNFYNLRFIRKKDGIYVEDDGISLAIDGIEGRIYSYSLDWFRGDLPSSKDLISLDRAYEVLWDKIGLELAYVKIYPKDREAKEAKEAIRLLYRLRPDKPVIISGDQRNLLNHRGEIYEEDLPISYKDLEGSYAKNKILSLAQYGIGFQEENFRPKDGMLEKDFLFLLWKAANPWGDKISQEDLYKMDIVRPGEMDPEAIISKEKAVGYIIRQLGLDKVARMEDIYKDLFLDTEDIGQGLKGYMNLAYGLGIISGDGKGRLDPKYGLRREDGASMIYNYLFK